MSDFHLTRMGRTYYEHTVPELVRQIERLNENLERLTKRNDTNRKTDDSGNEEDTQAPHP